MGRELQKKKNRSSLNKVRRKPKSKKKILSNPIIAAHWNQKETLAQNYHRLGLTSRLNGRSGGVEKTDTPALSSTEDTPGVSHGSDRVLAIKSKPPSTIMPSEAHIERDPASGAIVRVLDDPSATERDNPLNDPLNELDDSDPEEWTGFDHIPSASIGVRTSVIEELEEAASMGARKAPRKQSQREQEWIQTLVDRHGDNYGAMFRDRKFNPMQQSEGDIKRRVRKWKESQV